MLFADVMRIYYFQHSLVCINKNEGMLIPLNLRHRKKLKIINLLIAFFAAVVSLSIYCFGRSLTSDKSRLNTRPWDCLNYNSYITETCSLIQRSPTFFFLQIQFFLVVDFATKQLQILNFSFSQTFLAKTSEKFRLIWYKEAGRRKSIMIIYLNIIWN